MQALQFAAGLSLVKVCKMVLARQQACLLARWCLVYQYSRAFDTGAEKQTVTGTYLVSGVSSQVSVLLPVPVFVLAFGFLMPLFPLPITRTLVVARHDGCVGEATSPPCVLKAGYQVECVLTRRGDACLPSKASDVKEALLKRVLGRGLRVLGHCCPGTGDSCAV